MVTRISLFIACSFRSHVTIFLGLTRIDFLPSLFWLDPWSRGWERVRDKTGSVRVLRDVRLVPGCEQAAAFRPVHRKSCPSAEAFGVGARSQHSSCACSGSLSDRNGGGGGEIGRESIGARGIAPGAGECQTGSRSVLAGERVHIFISAPFCVPHHQRHPTD